jgi:hypothetical protein
LGFSLTFLRSVWAFEERTGWKREEIVSEFITALGIAFQLFALFRALNIVDDNVERYRNTVRVFKAGIIGVVLGVILSITLK